jgi:cytochrome c peroxidase
MVETIAARESSREIVVGDFQPPILPEAGPREDAYIWEALPDTAPVPPNNLMTPNKIALGKKLFFDTRLSADGSVSCASCHQLTREEAGGDGLPTSIGIDGKRGPRNAPTVLNAAFQSVLFWDGRAHSLEEQAKSPLTNPLEMGMLTLDAVVDRIRGAPDYRNAFSLAFPEAPSITIDQVVKAIAAYERTLITPDSPYDRFINGAADALSERQIRGMALFESAGCVLCHSGPNFSGSRMDGESAVYRIFPAVRNTGYESKYHLTDDLGAASYLPGSDVGVWRIPSLRNVARTAPYFHNGSVNSLEEAVRIMASVQSNRTLSNIESEDWRVTWSDTNKQLHISGNLALSDLEIEDIVAFLEALNGEFQYQE